MSWTDSRTTQDEILLAFRDRLQTHADLNDSNCVISDQAVPISMPSGGIFVTVSPGGGRFPDRAWSGGHHATATENGSIIVGIYLPNMADKPGNRHMGLLGRKSVASPKPTDKRKSIMAWKQIVLSKLLVEDPAKGPGSPIWIPTKNGKPILRDCPIPTSSTDALDVPEHTGWIGLQLTFAVTWDWYLYG